MVKQQYLFVKVPLDEQTKNKYPLKKNFGPQPELYLELLENKQKVKPELIGTQYKFYNSDEHDAQRRLFNEQTSRPDAPREGSASESECSGEDSEFEFEDEEEHQEEDRKSNYEKFLTNEQKPWAAATPGIGVSFTKREIPSLDQLKNAGRVNTARNVEVPGISQEDKKRELLFKFEILKKSYKTRADKIPECTIHTPLEQMESIYEMTRKHLKLDDSVDGNKRYLMVCFMLIEWMLGRFFKLDMEGFSKHQISKLDEYDKLLFELGEKKYSPVKKEWPVEVRLAIMVLFNAAAFVFTKALYSGNMTALTELMNGIFKKDSNPKRKMRGPNVNLDDLP